MQDSKGNLFTRNDTMFGVCEGLGQDFGFNPLYLRLAFAVLLIPFPMPVMAAYAAAAVLVLFSRVVFPVPRRKAEAAAAAPVTLAAERKPVAETAQVELAAAA